VVLFEQQHLQAVCRQRGRSGHSADAGADDDYIVLGIKGGAGLLSTSLQCEETTGENGDERQG